MNEDSVKIMGVLNVTPDSFFDGGKYTLVENAVKQALSIEKQGATIIDIGGESTRPGATPVSVDEEIDRVFPVINAIRQQSDVKISIDTSKSDVMRAAIQGGADIINDVCALQMPGAMQTAADLNVPVCLMHMLGEPRSMQVNPVYENVVDDVLSFLNERAESCVQHGIEKKNIWLDPGFGFGKTVNHNLSLLKHLDQLTSTKYPILVGLSRKSMLGKLLNLETEERLHGSLALATMAIMKGASIVRVHDVRETLQIVKLCEALQQAE